MGDDGLPAGLGQPGPVGRRSGQSGSSLRGAVRGFARRRRRGRARQAIRESGVPAQEPTSHVFGARECGDACGVAGGQSQADICRRQGYRHFAVEYGLAAAAVA